MKLEMVSMYYTPMKQELTIALGARPPQEYLP